MKLFDILGGKVVIHPDALGIPCFKRIWDADKSKDKRSADNYISYIVLNNKYNSPYVETIPEPEAREQKLKYEHFGDPEYKLPDDVQHAEAEFRGFLNKLTLRLLGAARRKIYSIIKYYEESLNDELDEKRVKDILAGIASLGNVIKSIDLLESNARAEEISNTKIRGGATINPYELPNRNKL